MFNNETVMDHIRPDTLFSFIRHVYRESRKPARFLYEGDGLRIITDDDTLLNDWSPRQVEQALRDLEVVGKVAVAYRVAGPRRTSIVDYHVAAYPLKSVRLAKEWGQVPENLSVAELTERVRTDDEFCATLIQDIYLQSESFDFLACYRALVYEDYILYHRIFSDIYEDLMSGNSMTRSQLAICRMPDETGLRRLVRHKRQVDDLGEEISRANLLFSLYILGGYNGSPIEFVESEDRLKPLADNVIGFTPRADAVDDLERAGSVTLRRDGDRVIVTSLTVPEHLKIAFQEHPFFRRILYCSATHCETAACQ